MTRPYRSPPHAGRYTGNDPQIMPWMAYPCIEFDGYKNDAGYGITGATKRRAHRIAWELFRGPIPAGLEIDHLCRNRACMNPNHLEPVTHRENCLRGESPAALAAKKTHCSKGHELDGKNSHGFRYCKKCVCARSSEYQKRPEVKARLRIKDRARYWRAKGERT